MSVLNDPSNELRDGVLYDSRGCVITSLAADDVHVITPDTAFLETDIQTAFMNDHFDYGFPIGGGGLAVKGAHEVVPVALKVHGMFKRDQKFRYRDSHRRGHISFATSFNPRIDPRLRPFFRLTPEVVREWGNDSPVVSPHFGRDYLLYYLEHTLDGGQVLWWEHAMEDTEQCLTHPLLRDIKVRVECTKGGDPLCDSYSPLMDNMGRPTGLHDIIGRHRFKKVVTLGIAYDICAGEGAYGANQYGFETVIVKDGCRSVSLEGEKAMDAKLLAAGVKIIQSEQLAPGTRAWSAAGQTT